MSDTSVAPTPSTTVAENSAFGGPTAAQAAAGNAALAGKTSSPAPLISTSSASRSTTANNVATMNGAVAALPGAPGSSTNGGPDAQKDTPTGTTINIGGAPAKVDTQGTNIPGTPGYNPTGGTPLPTDTSTTDSGSPIDSAVSGLPPSMQALYKSNLQAITDQQTQAKSVLAQASATLQNDPAATAAIAAIGVKFDELITQMGKKNEQILGKAGSAVGAFGGLGVMSQSFLSNEMDQATQRIASLTTAKQNAMLAAQAAYNSKNLAAFNAATSAYNKTISDMSTAISQLNTATSKAITEAQAQSRLENTLSNSQISNDLKNAKGVGASIAEKLAAAGVTDLAGYDYTDLAQQLGINDPEILASAVQTAGAASAKADLAATNVQNQMDNRDAGTKIKQQNANKPKGGGGTPTFNVSKGIATVTPQMEAELKASGSTDGYIAPQKWIAARTNWQSLGGTEASFKSNYIKYLNPASYKMAGYKAPAAASGSTNIQDTVGKLKAAGN